MHVSDDEQDEALLKLQKLHKINPIQCIKHMNIPPKEASQFDIPLCQMVYMPLVQPTFANDIKKLEAKFIHGYWPNTPLFYVYICNKHGEECSISNVDRSSWALTKQ